MIRCRVLVCLLGVALLAGSLVAGDTPKPADVKDPAPKGQLPASWKKIGLTDEQVKQIYKIQGDYRPRIEELEQKIKDLRAEELTKEIAVLTDAQKARLKEIAEEKLPLDPPKKDDKDEKKPDEKKPEEKKP
jgi:hypothetical protein